ncbi:GNAT family N-acetyltransferase [Bacteriovorax sp. PP10]|uniref:GNAT family N-acetyltransferase n=1 Tax=Bacteriovorax antarcticus TaxID=3088717 RepID=A0ABU5VWF5_9BACT|nr:GNAT family N-acetyltransferase [Bacteriovorax sp. PP10]MEA9355965.1 GNAT family N-acetyltransferase [Bacteriovorax sp. PP10]
MNVNIENYQGFENDENEFFSLLIKVYCEEGFTEPAVGQRFFILDEVKKRGEIVLAREQNGKLLGIIICAHPDNLFRKVAECDEAETHLLAVDPSARRVGLAQKLCMEFERKAKSLGYSKLVLSTHPEMLSAHRLYERLGYQRNTKRDWIRNNRQFLVYEKLLPNN